MTSYKFPAYSPTQEPVGSIGFSFLWYLVVWAVALIIMQNAVNSVDYYPMKFNDSPKVIPATTEGNDDVWEWYLEQERAEEAGN